MGSLSRDGLGRFFSECDFASDLKRNGLVLGFGIEVELW